MRLPRWLVTCLLAASGIATLAAPCWWWITWPDRTARGFIALVSLGRFEDANVGLAPPTNMQPPAKWRKASDEITFGPFPARDTMYGFGFTCDEWQQMYQRPVQFDRPSFGDLVAGRRRFRPDGPIMFEVNRNKLWPEINQSAKFFAQFRYDDTAAPILPESIRFWDEEHGELRPLGLLLGNHDQEERE